MANSKNNRRKINTKKVLSERPHVAVDMKGGVVVPSGNVSVVEAIGMLKMGMTNLESFANARYIRANKIVDSRSRRALAKRKSDRAYRKNKD